MLLKRFNIFLVNNVRECISIENRKNKHKILLFTQICVKYNIVSWWSFFLQINLITQLPESDKTKERLSEILEERDLTFLYPLLRIQADLSRQLQVDSNPQSFYKWIKENLEPSNFIDPGFINALMTVLLKYICQVSNYGKHTCTFL